MWKKRKADPQLIETIKELVFMNQHTNLTTDRMFRLLPETDCYFVLDALAEARDLGYIYCASGRWALRVKYPHAHVPHCTCDACLNPRLIMSTPSGVTKRSVHNERLPIVSTVHNERSAEPITQRAKK